MDFVIRDLSPRALTRDQFRNDPEQRLLIFKDHNPSRRYYMGIDIGSGLGLSNSVIEVIEEGTLYSPDEQVAEFASNLLNPHEMAPVINLIGNMWWSEQDDLPAMACIEVNNKGESTQYDLINNYGYPNVFVRQMTTAVDPRFKSTYGWETTMKTRPAIVLHFYHQFQRGQLIINSPWLIDEMQDFRTRKAVTSLELDSEREAIASGKAKVGALDDRVMATAIGCWCLHEMSAELKDPAVERQNALDEAVRMSKENVDYRNSDAMAPDLMSDL